MVFEGLGAVQELGQTNMLDYGGVLYSHPHGLL